MSIKPKVIEKIKEDPLMPLRHSAEHVLHTAVESLFNGAKKVMGPPIENGFYGDFDYEGKIIEEDLVKIEKVMYEIIEAKLPLEIKKISVGEAKKIFGDNKYKLELLKELSKEGKEISICELGSTKDKFHDIDLCAGPHVKNTSEVKAFKLLNIAGAYWRGDEKNKMLTRIYATAFSDKKSLDDCLDKLEEIKKRDHRIIGKALELFTMSEEVGPGLPLWLPNGTIIKEELEKWGKETEDKWGYKRVSTPFMAKKALFEISGHVPYFEDEMYKVSVPGDEGEEYFIKPMNCPFHHMIYKSKPRSYRDLPLRLAEYGTVARYENRGSINGILRPRLFVQNDAHVYCSEEQVIDVFIEIINLHKYYYDVLGLNEYYIVLGLRDPSKKDKYHGDEEMWQKAEKLSREAMEKAGIEYRVENEGAAHYGPKMDLKIKSAIGAEYGISTNQIDLYMPIKFNLTYTDKDGKEKFVVVQHRAPLGSSERFIGFLTEHFAGNFPLWLSPLQVKIIPIGEKHVEYAQKIEKDLKAKSIRVEVDSRNDTMQSKIRDAQMFKVPYMVILGDREAQSNTISLRLRTGENLGSIPRGEFAAKVEQMYLTKSLKLW
jgi:threonyl-tRNA synthetase